VYGGSATTKSITFNIINLYTERVGSTATALTITVITGLGKCTTLPRGKSRGNGIDIGVDTSGITIEINSVRNPATNQIVGALCGNPTTTGNSPSLIYDTNRPTRVRLLQVIARGTVQSCSQR
jgi:hypothetical protein